jgi:catechol 2,3-dioxygenase-like lactoylglutathione lyase family enzyme
MIQTLRLGHATIETPDLQKSLDYFVGVSGFVLAEKQGDRAFLTTKIGQLALILVKSDRADCTRLAFEVAADTDFAAAQNFLTSQGIKSEMRGDPFPGTPKALTFTDPKGTVIELFANWSFLTVNQGVAGIGPLKIGHIAFFTPDVKGICDFYQRVLGFRVSDWIGDFFVFMRCNSDHHTLNFFAGKRTHLHHLAMELKDMSHMQQSCEVLGAARIPLGWGPMRHGPGHNMATYHRNPDEHVIEHYIELDQMKSEALGYFEPRPWHIDRPQRPKVWEPHKWVSGWGLPPVPGFLGERD